MRTGIIYYGTCAKNRGLDQLAQALIELGYETFIVARNGKHVEEVSDFNGVPVIQLPKRPNSLSGLLNFHLPFNFLWTIWIFLLAKKLRWNAIFLRETPLSLAIIVSARMRRIPIFLDMRENLPATYAMPTKGRYFWRIFQLHALSRFYEKHILPHFDHIFVSTDELSDHLRKEYAIRRSSQSVLGNYPSRVFLEHAQNALINRHTEQRTPSTEVRLVFAGAISENRGLQDIIQAFRVINEKSGNCRILLDIIGEGPYLNKLKRLVFEFGLSDLIRFIPLLPPSKVAGTLVRYDIGICSYLLDQQSHHTLPGKLFEYMAVGLPVLSSARRPVIRILEQFNCGLIYRSRRADEIADKILYLANNRAVREDMGERGVKAINEHFNWKCNLRKLKYGILGGCTPDVMFQIPGNDG